MSGPQVIRVHDVVVIGAGPVGENIAQYATEESGLTAVLVERELVGGECSYYACMPSKALLRPLEVIDAARHLGGVSGAHLDIPGLLRRRDEWVSHYDDASQVDWATSAGLDVVRGSGRITGEREVTVTGAGGEVVLQARHTVVLATGSEPVVPDMYAACAPWESRDATGVVELPDRVVVIGGGWWPARRRSGSALSVRPSRWSCAIRGCSPGWSPSPRRWSSTACAPAGSTSGSTPR